MGAHLASSSHDKTWRLWDLETQQCLLTQEGHAAEVYPISMHADGSLLVSGDLQGVGLLWDLRIGQNILQFTGGTHQGNKLTCLQFLPTGYHLATAGDTNCVSIWDLRKQAILATVPAHNKMVSDVKFEQRTSQGRLMYTASYDNQVRIFGNKCIVQGENTCDDWVALRTLLGHENKVTSVSVTKDMNTIITTSFDRCFKLWQAKADTIE